ncbi:MAG: DUF3800 domain-containing protein [Nitrospira sp.]|nr:DUF3800 domain-containing protein [Nitrospira sp.]
MKDTAPNLTAYFDESGIHENASHCIVAGFVGSEQEWNKFEARWQTASGGVVFHGNEFFSRKPDGERTKTYKGWSDLKAEAYLTGLVKAITSTRLTPVGAVVDVRAFMAFTERERRYLTGAVYKHDRGKFITTGVPGKPYFMALMHCISAATHCIRRSGLKVNFVFDRQDQYQGNAIQLFQRACEEAQPEQFRKRLGEIAFRDKSNMGALQAADLLTHACYRRTKLEVGQNSELDFITKNISPMSRKQIAIYDEASLSDLLSKMPEHIRQSWKDL